MKPPAAPAASLGEKFKSSATVDQMDDAIKKLLAPRIVKNCMRLLKDGHFRHSAREAMVQVEIALREKGKVKDVQFGTQLIGGLFAGKAGVKLRVPLGMELQNQALKYFNGVFSYYRNYTAHDGSRIDEKIALRILIIASELLELIDASELTLTDSGGVEGLVRIGGFGTAKRLGVLLNFLNSYCKPEGSHDGLFEDLGRSGLGEPELQAVFDLKLVEMHSGKFEAPNDQFSDGTDALEWFELTELGQKALESIDGVDSLES